LHLADNYTFTAWSNAENIFAFSFGSTTFCFSLLLFQVSLLSLVYRIPSEAFVQAVSRNNSVPHATCICGKPTCTTKNNKQELEVNGHMPPSVASLLPFAAFPLASGALLPPFLRMGRLSIDPTKEDVQELHRRTH
jgi:hypothetical protein